MGRPKEFDRSGALDLAVEVFWERGYECASIQELVQRMGIHRASLYDTFGSKHDLFCEAFDRYSKRVIEEWLAPLCGDGDTRRLLEQVTDDLLAGQCSGRNPACLVVKTALGPVQGDARTRARLREHVGKIEDGFASALARGQARREIRADLDARVLARYLVMILQGLTVSTAIEPDLEVLRETLRVALVGCANPQGREAGGN